MPKRSLLLAVGGEKKTETIKTVDGFASSCWLDGALARAHHLDRLEEFGQNRRRGNGNVVGSKNES